MKQNVNFALLGLLLLVIVSMIGLVIYYYTTYEGLSAKYDEALVNLENVSMQINQTQNELSVREVQLREKEKTLLTYLSELNISKERETTLGSHFTDLKGEVSGLEENLNSTLDERNRYASLYDKYYAESQEYKGKYNQEHILLTSANNKVSRMKGDAIEMESNIQGIKDDIDSISANAAKIDDDAKEIENEANSTQVEDLAGNVRQDVDKIDSLVSDIDSLITRLYELTDKMKGS